MNQQNKELWTSQKAFHDCTAVATLLYAREDTNSNQKSNVSNKRKITKIKQRKDVKNQKWKWKKWTKKQSNENKWKPNFWEHKNLKVGDDSVTKTNSYKTLELLNLRIILSIKKLHSFKITKLLS